MQDEFDDYFADEKENLGAWPQQDNSIEEMQRPCSRLETLSIMDEERQ